MWRDNKHTTFYIILIAFTIQIQFREILHWVTDVSEKSAKLKYDWAGHVCRMSDEWTAQNINRLVTQAHAADEDRDGAMTGPSLSSQLQSFLGAPPEMTGPTIALSEPWVYEWIRFIIPFVPKIFSEKYWGSWRWMWARTRLRLKISISHSGLCRCYRIITLCSAISCQFGVRRKVIFLALKVTLSPNEQLRVKTM